MTAPRISAHNIRSFFRSTNAAIIALLTCTTVQAEQTTIAVASNFKPVLDALQPAFEQTSGHELVVASGSTGKLSSQIRLGAPFDVLLSADDTYAENLIEDGFAKDDSAFIYGIGQPVLWSAKDNNVGLESLRAKTDGKLAVATPAGAPYGIAAEQVLHHYQLTEFVKARQVFGENVGQAFAFVYTGTAEFGIVALSQVLQLPESRRGYYWTIPGEAYEPLDQMAVLLNRGIENEAAEDFLDYLASDEAKDIIRNYGYTVP